MGAGKLVEVNFFDRSQRAGSQPPRWMKPQALLGGSVALEMPLARGDDVALGIGGLIAYPNGFSFTITAVLRQEDRQGRIFDLAFHRDFFDQGPPPAELLRVGVRFADGSAADCGHPDPEQDAGPLLVPDGGGGGGGRRYEMAYWVWPLPPPGPVTFVCSWPAQGIAETRISLDAGLIREGAARALPLWPG